MARPAAFYPAPGFRDAGGRGVSAGGTLSGVGGYGYSWSSSASDSYDYYLDFNYSRIVPNGNNNRAYGFQLRCLQE